jgi:CheY-like chemotaxis protein
MAARPLPRIASAAVLLHAGPPDGPEGPLAVLVLAERPDVRERLALMLRGAGHRTDALASPGAALDRLHLAPYDALVAAFRPPAAPVLALARALRAMPPPMGRIALLGLAPTTSERQRRDIAAAGFDHALAELVPPAEDLLEALRRAARARWGPGPLNADLRDALAARLAPEALEASDDAAMRAAGERALALRAGGSAWTAAAVREAAEEIAAALAPVGALAAPAAARALATAPERRNALLPPLLSSLVALRGALRRDREARSGARGPISGAGRDTPHDPKDDSP